jgi:hypothetical protein
VAFFAGNPGGVPGLEAALRTHNWLVHGTWHGAHLRIAQPAAALELAPPQVWQRVDLEHCETEADAASAAPEAAAAAGCGGPIGLLRWQLATGGGRGKGRELAGFLFSSRFFFTDSADTLDARRCGKRPLLFSFHRFLL